MKLVVVRANRCLGRHRRQGDAGQDAEAAQLTEVVVGMSFRTVMGAMLRVAVLGDLDGDGRMREMRFVGGEVNGGERLIGEDGEQGAEPRQPAERRIAYRACIVPLRAPHRYLSAAIVRQFRPQVTQLTHR